MSRPPNRLTENLGVERITPSKATTLLINGLIPAGEAEGFKPTNLTAKAIVRLLHKANEVRNRTVSIDTVSKYARDMREGDWLWTGEPIQIDHDGYVRNGQHRLLAIIESGTTQDFVVIRNLDPRAQLVIDVGRTRTIGNQMHMAGVASANHITAIANVLIRWRIGRMLNTNQATVMEIRNMIEREPTIVQGLAATHRIRRNVRNAPQAALGAAFVEAGHIDVEARDQFYELLTTGANLEAGNPVLVLRNRLQGQVAMQVRFRRAGQLWQIIHCWNLWRQGKSVQLLRVPSSLTSETFPVMK